MIKLKRCALVFCIFSMLMLYGCKNENTTKNDVVRLGGLKGPTSMGLVWLLQNEKKAYSFSMKTAADELVTDVVSGKVDIALVPANLAANLYQKTNGNVTVVEINTLGVLYLVKRGESISSLEQLKGKKVYLTGKGQTPEYVFTYLLNKAGISLDDVSLEYLAESAEVLSKLKENENAIGLLPQPFVTTAISKVPDLAVVLDLNKLWDSYSEGKSMQVTGVTIVRNEFLKEHTDLVEKYLLDHEKALNMASSNETETANLIDKLGIVSLDIAKACYKDCNIVSIKGAKMKTALMGYLGILYEQNNKSIGGKMPGEDFYFVAE